MLVLLLSAASTLSEYRRVNVDFYHTGIAIGEWQRCISDMRPHLTSMNLAKNDQSEIAETLLSSCVDAEMGVEGALLRDAAGNDRITPQMRNEAREIMGDLRGRMRDLLGSDPTVTAPAIK